MLNKNINFFSYLLAYAGVQPNQTSHHEKLVSGLGALIGIGLTYFVSQYFVTGLAQLVIVASMGASAVLLFAVPHGTLSQPWPVVGGHLLSALTGVLVAQWVPNIIVASALAVALAIVVMHYCQCIHPPGGATALVAVIGGTAVQDMGYAFALVPVLLNAVILVLSAVAFNWFFRWRRYPLALRHKMAATSYPDSPMHTPDEATQLYGLKRDDFNYALNNIDSFVDISHDELEQLFVLAAEHAKHSSLHPEQILLGHYYSNGRFGEEWSVRMVVDESGGYASGNEMVIYKVVAGNYRRESGSCTRKEFAQWASHEVLLNENSWQRVTTQEQV